MSTKPDISKSVTGARRITKKTIASLFMLVLTFAAGIIIAKSTLDPGLAATLKIGLLFVMILILIRENIAIEWALISGSVVLGFFFKMQPVEFVRESFYGAIDPMALMILGIVYFITVLGTFMDRSGHMKRLMDSLTELIRDSRFVAAIAPALIGLMPMPGGALFSAPMVESVGKPLGWSRPLMAAINFWCRHVWEYVWPMYAGILLSFSILNIEIPKLILYQSPLTVAAILGGLIFLILPIKKPARNSVVHTLEYNLGEIWQALWPIVMVIVITMVPFPNPKAIGVDAKILTTFKMLISLIIATFMFAPINGITWSQVKEDIIICLKRHTIAIVLSIMIFKHLIEHTQAAVQMAPYFAELGLPPIMVVSLLCFIVGMLTGITMAYVGICYPIIAPLMTLPSGELDLSLVQFAYVSGFIGVMLTPVHLCFALTREYFNVEWRDCYVRILPPAAFLFIVGLIIALVW